ncbi:MAG TPA: hypothetical protein P5247_03105 [Candidatus Saccharimonadales bacterium]|nr:hypothetical protein [Candidatus Saccharimonadales bacterium]
MKILHAIWWCATLTLSALFLAGASSLSINNHTYASPTASEIKHNINTSPKSTKLRILGASMFSFSILTTIIVLSREIKTSRPDKEQILRKYYRS